MYKYTRKERIVKYLGDSHYEIEDLLLDLLAQKEDRKECKHNQIKRDNDGSFYCHYCGKKLGKHYTPTLSPLEGFEEIEEIKLNKDRSYSYAPDHTKIQDKINQLISNQKKLYQYIKEKNI